MPLAPNRQWSGVSIVPLMNPERAKSINVKLPASVTYPKGTILGEKVGVDEIQSLIKSGTVSGGTFTLSYGGYTTSAIAYDATAATIQAALLALKSIANNAIQTLTKGTVSSGTYRLAYGGQETADLAYNISAADLQTALEGLGSIGTGNVTVTGSAGGPWTIEFGGMLANTVIPALGIKNSLVGASPTLVIAIVNPGGGGGENVLCAGGPAPSTAVTIKFQNRLGKQGISAITVDNASITGGGTMVISEATAGSAGTPGTFAKCVKTATDGSQIAKAILQVDCVTDSSGNITYGAQSGGNEFGQSFTSVPAWVTGMFATTDLVGLTDAMVDDMGRLVSGSIGAGGILEMA